MSALQVQNGLIGYPLSLLRIVCSAFVGLITDFGKGTRLILGIILKQVYFTAVQGLLVVSLTAVLVGGVIQLENMAWLAQWVERGYLIRMSLFAIFRELAPLLTMLIVVGRSGTAISTEISSIKLNRELDLYESMGINPRYFLLFPRIIGVPLSLLCLTFWFALLGTAGGYYILSLALPNVGFNLEDMFSAVNVQDVAALSVKSIVFGMIITSVSCVQGLQVRSSVTEIPRAVTKAFVNSVIACIFAEAVLTILFFADLGAKAG